jgi:transcriptional regulator with XRE-family HTH domain
MRPEEIRALRESLGLSQAQLENLLNVGPKTVVRWERGTVFQSGAVNTLLKVLRARPDVLGVLSDANKVELRTLAAKRAAKAGSGRSRPPPWTTRGFLLAASVLFVLATATVLLVLRSRRMDTPPLASMHAGAAAAPGGYGSMGYPINDTTLRALCDSATTALADSLRHRADSARMVVTDSTCLFWHMTRDSSGVP